MFNKKNQRVSSSMNSFFPKNHKAQVGETMTWVVATIVIVVVLSFSILISINIFDDKEFGVERKTDLLATKSLTGFLAGQSNLELIKNSVQSGDYDNLENKFKPFLESLSIYDAVGWNLEIYVDNDKKHDVITKDIFGFYRECETDFDLLLDSKKIKLKFWEESQGGCLW